ncbi:MAG: tetratricopeptide repeat protein [Verrucomicrobia bacterium]|nr:tetratricopeptide repeat protein [Verrucomicrobiota bacterium]
MKFEPRYLGCNGVFGRWLSCALLLTLLLLAPRLGFAASAEDRAFNDAAKSFQDGAAERAERLFADFVLKFPESPRGPEAILLQARAAFARDHLPAALALLSTNLARAGQAADQYRFWLGRMRLESGDAKGAAAEFAQLLTDYTNSPRRLEASFDEARARLQLADYPSVIELLRKPEGAFQRAAKAGGDAELIARGELLLGEALFKQRDFRAAEAVAQRVPAKPTEIAWGRQFLLCRLELATEREESALRATTNLLALAAASGKTELSAHSLLLQASILEEMQDYDAALAAYDRLQSGAAPEGLRREAFLKSVELLLTLDNLSQATARLERFLATHPEDAASDEVLLTLGELRLKEHFLPGASRPVTNGLAAPLTNRLQQAIAWFEQLPQKHPNSPHLGRAYLNRGWALLADGKNAESQAAFQMATNRLPFGDDQAIARFKLADIQFLQGDFTNALAGYRKVIDDYGGLPRIRTGLFDRAWYQIARVCLKLGDLTGADDAMRRILAVFPSSLYADRGLLLYGQELNRTHRAAEARAVFTEFTQRFTNSVLLPQAQLGLARACEAEHNWTAAIQAYDTVLARFPTNEVAPQAEFYRALAWDRAGRPTNALNLLTNFLVRFPTNEFAPRAQDWIGDFYFNAEEFVEAERNYQSTNWSRWLLQDTNSALRELQFQARFKAGRAAFMRQGHSDATNYFLSLINDKQCPPHLVAEAFFAYGDALLAQPLGPDHTNAPARLETALETFRKIPQLFPNSPLVPRALGRMADCYAQDPLRYTNALEFYRQALNAPQADQATRSQAEVGLGHTLVRLAQLKSPPDAEGLKSALDHYRNVIYGSSLADGEAPLPFWVKEAGLAAARLLESQRRWTELISLYERIQGIVPALKPSLDRRIQAATEQAAREEGK